MINNHWPAAASPGGLIGILGAILSLLLSGGAVAVLAGKASLPVPTAVVWAAAILFFALAIAFAYLVYGYLSIGYELTERALAIRWANRRYEIDLESIKSIGPAIDLVEERPGRWQRFWPGYYVGTLGDKIGPIQVIATLPLRRQLLISTSQGHFAISPERPVLFVEEYGRLRRSLDLQRSGAFPTVEPGQGAQRLAEAGWTMQYPTLTPTGAPPTAEVPRPDKAAAEPAAPRRRRRTSSAPAQQVSPLLRPILLNDTTSLALLALAVVLNVLMVTVILVRYESIPQSITLHWNVNGLPDRIGSPREIWILPIITGLVTVANFGLAWSIVTFDRFAARFLLAASCLVQLVAWVALVTLIF